MGGGSAALRSESYIWPVYENVIFSWTDAAGSKRRIFPLHSREEEKVVEIKRSI